MCNNNYESNIPSSSSNNQTGPLRKTFCPDKEPGEKTCRFGKYCRYAHNDSELNTPALLRPNYKTVPCHKYSTFGWCPYDEKCQFIHDEKEARHVPPKIDNEPANDRMIPKPLVINPMNGGYPYYMRGWSNPACGFYVQPHNYMGRTVDEPVRYGQTVMSPPCPVSPITWIENFIKNNASPMKSEQSEQPKECLTPSTSPSGLKKYSFSTVFEEHLKKMSAQPKRNTNGGFDPLFY